MRASLVQQMLVEYCYWLKGLLPDFPRPSGCLCFCGRRKTKHVSITGLLTSDIDPRSNMHTKRYICGKHIENILGLGLLLILMRTVLIDYATEGFIWVTQQNTPFCPLFGIKHSHRLEFLPQTQDKCKINSTIICIVSMSFKDICRCLLSH